MLLQLSHLQSHLISLYYGIMKVDATQNTHIFPNLIITKTIQIDDSK